MQLVCPACGTKNGVRDERLADDPRCGRYSAALMAPQPVALARSSMRPMQRPPTPHAKPARRAAARPGRCGAPA